MSLVATLKNWVLRGRADEAQVPEVQVLPDGRKRLTRRVKLANHTGAPDWLSVPYGTLDAEAAPAGWENLRLVGKALSDAPTPGGRDTSPMLVLIYETLIAPGETPVGEWKRVRLEDGRDAWTREWLQLLTETATPATVGAVYTVPAGTAYLQREEASPEAELGLRRIVRTCVTSGVLEIDTQTRNNGALVIKRITSAVTVPTTPAGFVLIGEPVQNPNGLPTYTYTFAKGDGLVSEQIAPLGTGLSRVTWVSLGTRLVPPGVELPGGATAEEDGYQRHTVSSLQGLSTPGETPVGEWKRVRLEDGRDAWSREWLQLLTETATPATVGAVYVVPAGTAYLQREETSPDAELGLRRIVRTCVTSGVLEIDTQTRNNGALVIKRITSAVTVPATPAGFVLIGEPVQNPNGLPTYTYTFAKGEGLVSEQRDPVGVGLSRVTWVSLGTRLVPEGVELPGGATVEEDGYQRHTVSSLQGLAATGETPVGEWKRVRLEDGRDAWTREWLQLLSETATPATVGAAYPATAIVEGVTTYLQREEAAADIELGLRRIVRTVATAGRVMESVESMEYGLRRVTWTCLGAEQTPTGVRVARRVQNVLGFPEFTVTCMQSPSGGNPAGYSFSFNRPVALTYPGRIKAYTTGVSGSSKVLAGVFMSPPVELSVVGSVTVSYSTSESAYFGTLYSPTMWATVEAKHLSRYGTPVATLEAMRGYIADGGTHQVEVTAPVFMDDVNSGGSIFGKLVYGGSTGYIRVSGGVDPKGNTYTISADNDPVFVDLAGVTYYRHVVVTAAFPSSIPDLPQVL